MSCAGVVCLRAVVFLPERRKHSRYLFSDSFDCFRALFWVVHRQELWAGVLDSLFVQDSWEILHHREWRAYPVLKPKEVGGAPSRGGGGRVMLRAEKRLGSITSVSLASSGGPWYKMPKTKWGTTHISVAILTRVSGCKLLRFCGAVGALILGHHRNWPT